MNSTFLFDRLLQNLPEGKILKVQVGLYWTAVVVNVDGQERCGLAATIEDTFHQVATKPAIAKAGKFAGMRGYDLAEMVHSSSPPEISIGLAGINALLPRLKPLWRDIHAEKIISYFGANQTVALVGHFPFVDTLREKVGTLYVLEQNPQAGDLPASKAAEILPQANVVAITAMTLLNKTLDRLLPMRQPGALTLLIGPTTPLSTILFDLGIDIISGAIVEDIDTTLLGVSQGANFHQLHHMGVRLVSLAANPARLKLDQSN